MVSDLCGVILVLITAELCASYQQNVESAIWYFPNNCRVYSRCQTGVFYEYVWHGTQWFKALCKTPRYDDISMLSELCYEYVICVLWMCYKCVVDVSWMCHECVMNVSRMCHECVMDVSWMCYGCVMDVSWMCHRCVMDVLWMCYGCYGCVRYVMDVLRMYAWWMNDGYFISTV